MSFQSSKFAILCAMIPSCSVCNDAALEERDHAAAKDYRKGNASS
jgi:hypothetical protein